MRFWHKHQKLSKGVTVTLRVEQWMDIVKALRAMSPRSNTYYSLTFDGLAQNIESQVRS